MDDVARIVEEKATEIYDRATREFATEHPEKKMDEESLQIARQRVTSQLMFALSDLKFPENADKKERIDGWYNDSIRQELAQVCKKSLMDEILKRQDSEDDGLSEIDRYLRKHGMGKR